MSVDDSAVAGEVTELLQQLIRNRCVNDGSTDSGNESRSVDTLAAYFDGSGLDVETYAARPGRANLVTRIEGRNPEAPTLLLMGHTDVVPANENGWQRDPFGGELVDGEVWGRGAVDMLNLTASMAVATRHLGETGFAPEGTLIYLAVADEEALGTWGADHLLQHERDAVAADYVVTESGGIPIPTPRGVRLPVIVGEKGTWWCTLRVRGTPGHASQPLRTDNALVKAAEVVTRLASYRPQADIHDIWRRTVEGLALPPEIAHAAVDPERIYDLCQQLPLGMARQAHACTHTTFAPTMIHGGVKTNVIPDVVDLQVDIRTLPGQSGDDVRCLLADALGDLMSDVEIVNPNDDPSTASSIDTPLWDALARITSAIVPDSSLMPMLTVGATDSRFFRRAGSVAYGFGLFSSRLTFDDYAVMFHGDDERVDVDSLRLSTRLWDALARDFLVAR